ncbi:MAG: EamA family transporter [Ktedonobacterales bacterium]
MLVALACMGVYIALFGVAALVEQPIARVLDAFQLDALLRIGSAVVAIAILGGAILFGLGGATLPGLLAALAGLGIGLISGTGSLCYCLALDLLPSDLAACLANGYLVVTVVLGVVLLHEPVTFFVLAGLALTIGGAIVLSLRGRPGHSQAHSQSASGSGTLNVSRLALVASPAGAAVPAASGRRLGLTWLAGYVILVGVGAFLEKLALQHLAPLQLNALAALGMVAVGLVAVGAAWMERSGSRPSAIEWRRMGLPALGIGAMIGAGSVFYFIALARMPVTVAAALANSYVLVTVVLAVPVFHQRMTWRKAGGVLAMLVGVVLLAL